MSYRIEYQWMCLPITANFAEGLSETHYVIAIEGGCNNLTTVDRDGRERRSREWEVGMIGTERQILRQTTRFASACEGAMLRPRGRTCTPEAYIRRIRRLLKTPKGPSWTLGHLGLGARLPAAHPLVSGAEEPGFSYFPERRFGEDFVKLIPTWRDQWARYFELLGPYLDDFSLSPWSTGHIHLMPGS